MSRLRPRQSLLKRPRPKYKIPLVRHDFPLAMHAWSFTAAVNARWFDTHSKALGDEYRDQVFANQASIVSPDVLLQFTEKFAIIHGLALPFAIDPQGQLAELVKADYALGQRIGIEHTPDYLGGNEQDGRERAAVRGSRGSHQALRHHRRGAGIAPSGAHNDRFHQTLGTVGTRTGRH